MTGTIARAGDRIDFVVTLGRDEHGSSGSLERQSAQGTVAIREVQAPSCDAVADALVLTLALSADPEGAATPASPLENEPQIPPAAAVPARPEDAPREAPAPEPQSTRSTSKDDAAGARTASSESSPFRVSVGAQGFVGSLVNGSALFGANAFADLKSTRGIRPSARVSLVANFANPTPDVGLALYLGRLEGCPASFGTTITLDACVALDLGAIRANNAASGGTSASDFWSALWGTARAAYAPSPSFALELQAGLSVPLTHYALAAGVPARTVTETERWTLGLGAGARVAFP